MQSRKQLAILLILAAIGFQPRIGEVKCTSLVVGKNASTTGHGFFGRTNDSSPYGAIKTIVYPAGSFKQGQSLTNPYLAHKYPKEKPWQYTFTHDSYKFFANPYMPYTGGLKQGDVDIYHAGGVNDQGVSVSATNTTLLRKEAKVKGNDYGKTGLDESFAALIVLAEANSALDGVERLGRLVETDGVGDKCGCLIMIGDQKESWIFETAGRFRWVATKVPDDKFLVIANDMVTDYVNLDDTYSYRGSVDLKDFAIKNGFAIYGPKNSPHAQDVNIAASYGDLNNQIFNSHRRWRGYKLFASSQNIPIKKEQADVYPMFVKPDKKISPLDEMNYHRDRYEGTPYDISTLRRSKLDYNGYELKENKQNVNDPKWIRPIGHNTAQMGHILELLPLPKEIGGRVWVCLAQPEDSVFLPYYGNITDTHRYCQTYVDGNKVTKNGKTYVYPHYQADSAYFIFQDLGFRGRSNRKLYGNEIKKYWQKYEAALWAEQDVVEKNILRLYQQNPADAAQYATEYSLLATQKALNRAALIRKGLLNHISTSPKTLFKIPADTVPYKDLVLLPNKSSSLDEAELLAKSLGLKKEALRQADYTTKSQPEKIGVCALNAKLTKNANFARVKFTQELLGSDYAAYNHNPNNVLSNYQLSINDTKVIGPQCPLTLYDAIKAGSAWLLSDKTSATVIIDFYLYDGKGQPRYADNRLILPDGKKDGLLQAHESGFPN